MKLAVFGLGYVGSVTSACLARLGHEVIGVDVNRFKVDRIAAGQSPIVEAGLGDLIASSVRAGRLRATTDYAEALEGAEASIVCVGTPSAEDGSLDLSHVRRMSHKIGETLAGTNSYHVLIVRSTMLPGSVEEHVVPLVESASNLTLGESLGVCYNPEFLREGTAVDDFFHPPLTVIGAADRRAADVAQSVFRDIEASVVTTTIRTAEMVKYVSNSFHALKVCFANEIGNLCKSEGIDSHEVMRIFCQDTKLNLSPYYLTPGFAFGGSCLPKDVRAVLHRLRQRGLESPVLESILPSNAQQIGNALTAIEKLRRKKLGIFGLSFKAETDDLRESPIIKVVESLVGKGYDLRVYDPNVEVSRIIGANKRFLEEEVPYLPLILKPTLEDVLDWAEVLVVANKSAEYTTIPSRLRPDQALVDLVRILPVPNGTPGKYVGLCW
jgi:GDP-mannose 6-dehydrogenase